MEYRIESSGIDRAGTARAGFTLVELMIATIVMGIVTSQLLLAFSHQHTSSLSHERTIEVQQEARLINDVILSDLRVAGFMVPAFAAVASLDGGPNGSDILCVSDSTVIDDSVLDDANSKFAGGSVSTAFTGISSSVTLSAGSMDIDSDGDVDFTVNGGILIGTGSEAHCGVITNIAGSTISFNPSTDNGFTASVNDVAVPAIVYQVVGTTLTRNTMVLSNHIEDLQVQFGVDDDNNGTVEGAEFPVDVLNPATMVFEEIENVRVSLTARELRGDPRFNGQFAAVANRVAGAADNFRRRRSTGDTVVRNLQ